MWWDTYGFSALVLCLILGYGFVLARYIPQRLHFVANIVAAAAAILLGLWNGLDFEAMGLGLHFVVKGIVVAGLCSVGIMMTAGLVTLLTPLRHITALPAISRPGTIAYETAVRIPLSTALSEEILFRGVLLATLMVHSPTIVAVGISSLAFGVWHVLPSLRDHSKVAIAPIIVATAIAGVFFCWLCLIASSIVAPWLIHWTINASALLAVHFIRKRLHDSK